jgi:hypothetical protein
VVEVAPMLGFGGDGFVVSGMAAGRQHCASAVVPQHYVLALVEEQSHVSWLLQMGKGNTEFVEYDMEKVLRVYHARIVGVTSQ